MLIGCYYEGNPRDLPDLLNSDVSPGSCFKLGQNKKLKYVGMTKGNECHGGDKFGSYGVVPLYECDITCKFDIRQKCGGKEKISEKDLFSVYNVDAY